MFLPAPRSPKTNRKTTVSNNRTVASQVPRTPSHRSLAVVFGLTPAATFRNIPRNEKPINMVLNPTTDPIKSP